MSNSRKWILLGNIILVCASLVWWWQDKGFEPFIACVGFVEAILISLFLNDDKEEVVVKKPSEVKLFNKYELLDKYPDFTNDFRDTISFKMIGTNYQSFLTRYYSSFEGILSRMGNLCFIGCEPTPYVIDELTYRSSSSREAAVTKSKIENFINTLGTFNKSSQSQIELKLLPYPPSYGLIKFDKKMGESKIYLKPYTFKGGGKNPVLIFDKEKDKEWFDYFDSQFEKMWSIASVKTIS